MRTKTTPWLVSFRLDKGFGKGILDQSGGGRRGTVVGGYSLIDFGREKR